MNKTKIDWADMSWNPISGCLNNCEYCYARKIAKRFEGYEYGPGMLFAGPHTTHMSTIGSLGKVSEYGENKIISIEDPYLCNKNGKIVKAPYPFGFAPTFHRHRLSEPARKTKPQNIFVCSMADLFGDWVPDEWIADVFKACESTPQHRYLFLTKNPKRYEKVLDRYFPPNMYFGWSQTGPMGNELNFTTHHSIQTFVSIEPLLKPFTEFSIKGIDWVIIGAETGNRKDKVVPKREWIESIVWACKNNEIPVFMKSSIKELMGEDFIQQYPWENTK